MAKRIITVCDRCSIEGLQLTTILGTEVCSDCVEDVRSLLATKPVLSRKKRLNQALTLVRKYGYVTGEMMANAFRDEPRKAYFALLHMKNCGKLIYRGKGVFALPESGYAERVEAAE